MPRITCETHYDGFASKLQRLGMEPLMGELREILTGFELRVLDEVDGNSGRAVRQLVDARFESFGWERAAREVGWIKTKHIDEVRLCAGAQVGVSAWADLVSLDVLQLRGSIISGDIDVGVLVLPDRHLALLLADRPPSARETMRHIDEWNVGDCPMAIIGFEHDGRGSKLEEQPASPKKPRAARSKQPADDSPSTTE